MRAPPANRRRIAVIYNPAAGRRGRSLLRRLLKRLREGGHEVLLRRTEAPGDATRIARALSPGEVDVVLAAGGDGTINEVANGLIGRDLPLAAAPMGTANVLAWELGSGPRIDRAARTVAHGTAVRIRPAIAGARGFLLMASAGLDARVVAGVDTGLKRRFGKAAYALAALREILKPDSADISVEIDGRRERAALAVVTHAAHYAGPFVIAPQARLGDAHLTVVLVRARSRLGLLRCGLALVANRIARCPLVDLRTARRVRFLDPEGEPVQSDGDVIGRIPLEITVGEEAVTLLVPDPGRVTSCGPDAPAQAPVLQRASGR